LSAIQRWSESRSLACGVARDFFIPGSDHDDVVQEALIALWVAARDYEPGHGTSFSSFATMVIKRRLSSCVMAATRQKHLALNSALRTTVTEDGKIEAIVDTLPHLHQVVDIAESREQLAAVIAAIRELPDFQRHCVIGIAEGKEYREIGPPKKVDNALTKARGKLRKVVREAV